MSVGTLLDRLEGVRGTGAGRWIARCPAHEDRRPSVAVRELDDGTVLLRCFAGCDVGEILRAIGLEIHELFPPRPAGHARRPERRAFPAADVILCIASEVLIATIAAERLARGEVLDVLDRERLAAAAARLAAARDEVAPHG